VTYDLHFTISASTELQIPHILGGVFWVKNGFSLKFNSVDAKFFLSYKNLKHLKTTSKV